MKKCLGFIFLVSILLPSAACKPSEEAIQFAMFQTEMARPTETVTATLTQTPTYTVTPTETNTPEPTETNTPTITPTTVIPLRELVISLKDIESIIPGGYKTEIFEAELESDIPGAVEVFTGFFKGERGYGSLMLIMVNFETIEQCEFTHTNRKNSYSSTILELEPDIKSARNAFTYEDKEKKDINLIFCQSNIFTQLSLPIPQGYNAQEVVFLMQLYGQKQLRKLENAGY